MKKSKKDDKVPTAKKTIKEEPVSMKDIKEEKKGTLKMSVKE